MPRTRGPTVKLQLLRNFREAALNAVQSFNNPLTTFKTETFIVLMVIAWTYLLHAYYRQEGVEYRYLDLTSRRRKFETTNSGAFKYWELSQCLKDANCPLASPTRSNLRFLIGLRNEIEHHNSAGVDEALTGKYVACVLNYDREITRLFGARHSVAPQMSYALQLHDLTSPHGGQDDTELLSTDVAKYISEFEAELSLEEYQHPHFSYRLLFVRKLARSRSQADIAIEFVSADSDLGQRINREYWVQREVERPKHLPSQVRDAMKAEGFSRFEMHHHTQLWKTLDAKNPGRGYGVQVASTWYWYDRWVDEVREHCVANRVLYLADPGD